MHRNAHALKPRAYYDGLTLRRSNYKAMCMECVTTTNDYPHAIG
jgi:hypothetical protein